MAKYEIYVNGGWYETDEYTSRSILHHQDSISFVTKDYAEGKLYRITTNNWTICEEIKDA